MLLVNIHIQLYINKVLYRYTTMCWVIIVSHFFSFLSYIHFFPFSLSLRIINKNTINHEKLLSLLPSSKTRYGGSYLFTLYLSRVVYFLYSYSNLSLLYLLSPIRYSWAHYLYPFHPTFVWLPSYNLPTAINYYCNSYSCYLIIIIVFTTITCISIPLQLLLSTNFTNVIFIIILTNLC